MTLRGLLIRSTSSFLHPHPVLLCTDSDSQVPTEQSVNFAKGIETVIGTEKVSFETLQGAGHGDQAFTTPENVAKVFAFLDKSLGVTSPT